MSPYRPRVTRQGDLLHLGQRSPTCRAAAGSQKSRRPLPAELERLTYVSYINSDTLAKRTTQAAYVLILVWARDRRPARRHGKSSSMAHIGRGVAVDAGAPMTAAYGADGHSHQRASSAEASESLGGRSSAIVRERLFRSKVEGESRAIGRALEPPAHF